MIDNQVLNEKIKEATSSVLPITLIVALLCLFFVPMDTGLMLSFLIGSLMLIAGMGLFTLGSEMAMSRIGNHIGAKMTKSRKLRLIIILSFVLGVSITIAEPDLQVLAGNVPAIDSTVLLITVSVGVGILLTVPLKSVAGGRTLSYLTDCAITGGKPEMNFEHELIIAVMNEGYSDTVMDAARAAGAGGGTVLHAKGTGKGRGNTFFDLNIADEKDMVYIVAHADEKAAIMASINEKAGPDTRAGAICFSLPISSVAGLRARDND